MAVSRGVPHGLRRRVALMVLTGSLFGSVACRSSASRELEAESAALGVRIDALRNAQNEAKQPLLEALQNTPCKAEPVCQLKRICVEAYTTHLAAIGASGRAKELLGKPDGGSRASLEAALVLNEAEAGLERARQGSERCAREQGRLRLDARSR